MSRLHSSNYGAAVSAFVVVLVPVLNKILIHEDEYEKNQIRSYAHALRRFLFSAFPPGRRPLRAGGCIPTSDFLKPDT